MAIPDHDESRAGAGMGMRIVSDGNGGQIVKIPKWLIGLILLAIGYATESRIQISILKASIASVSSMEAELKLIRDEQNRRSAIAGEVARLSVAIVEQGKEIRTLDRELAALQARCDRNE